MSPRDLLYEIWHALRSNKWRSALTVLGIVIGIASVVALTSLIEGFKYSLLEDVGASQKNLITVHGGYGPVFTQSDMEKLPDKVRGIDFVGTVDNQVSSSVFTKSRSVDSVTVNAVTPGIMDRSKKTYELAQGRYPTQQDDKQLRQVVVLSQDLVKKLYGSENEDVVGKTVRIGVDNFRIIGVVKTETGSFGGQMNSGSVYVPFKTAQLRLGSGQHMSQLLIYGQDNADPEQLKQPIIDALSQMHPDYVAQAESSNTSGDMSGGMQADAFMVTSSEDLIKIVSTVTNVFSALLGSVAAISLLVGGIGIMNMMLTNVTERIREIGLRKSLGATRKDIERQFIGESVLLCLIGGVIGMLCGYLAAQAIASIVTIFQPDISLSPVLTPGIALMACGVSALIGIVFGWSPARKAAKLDPVEALRHQ